MRAAQRYVKKQVPAAPFAHTTFDRAVAQGTAALDGGVDPHRYLDGAGHDRIATLQYTGGTTGVSKGAVLTEGNLLANIVQCIEVWKPGVIAGQETVITALPLYHIFAFTANLMVFFVFGGRNILLPSPRPLTNLKQALTSEGATWLTGVNTLFAGLMHEPWFQQHSGFTLKGTVAGGMALVPVVGERWEAMTRTPIYQGYGLTESSPVVSLVPFHRNKRESIGVPVPGTDVRIVDSDGHDVAAGEPGELLVRGPQVMAGYWQRPDETARVLRDGWLSTGDVATADADTLSLHRGSQEGHDPRERLQRLSQRGRGGHRRASRRGRGGRHRHPRRNGRRSGVRVRRAPRRGADRSGDSRLLPPVAHRLQGAAGRALPRRPAQIAGRQGAAQGSARPGQPRLARGARHPMDPLCHTLTGLAMGHAGLKRRTPLALTTLALAANAPDIDIAVLATDTLQMSFRRGWTHGPPAMVLLPLALAGLILAYDRLVRQRRHPAPAPVVPAQLLGLAALGTWSHPLLDYMNSYGIRLLMPFSERWFYGDALYIVDPWLYLLLGLGVVWAIRARVAAAGRRAARVTLAAAALYVALMYGSNLWARAEVRAGLTRAGRGEARFMVTPVPFNPFRREVLVDIGDRYEKGFLAFSPAPRFRPAGYGVIKNDGHPAARAAAASERGRQFLGWSRFPFFVVTATATGQTVTVNDARYSGPSGREGWAGVVIDVP